MITFDTTDFEQGLDTLEGSFDNLEKVAVMEMADTLLLLSREEVPLDTGRLSGSGFTKPVGNEGWVIYNTEYASYQHEGMRRDGTHVVMHYQGGRKKKYLEDPMKNNVSKWEKIAVNKLEETLQ